MTESNKKQLKIAIGIALVLIGLSVHVTVDFVRDVLYGNYDYYFSNNNDYFDGYIKLDKSSPEAFIEDVREVYDIRLRDAFGYLSGTGGERMMDEIELGLGVFSPDFIKSMTAMYEKRLMYFIIILDQPSDIYAGTMEWKEDLVITLHYNRMAYLNGITAQTLAHEIAHAITFIIQETKIGYIRLENDMNSINRGMNYVGNSYHSLWDRHKHSTTFAYSYGMSNFYEDIATIFEYLVYQPHDMEARLGNTNNEPLYQKVEYIMKMTYQYISDDCRMVFEPFENAVYKSAA
ncbi:MAG: hypothetical protein FWD34_01865 [Oscillospiraceae bacterium]|nr:hypothetical protein [Oscillospiraceae bacterium]